MPAPGDMAAVQAGFLQIQGRREYEASQQGALRWCTFYQPMSHTGPGSSYTPTDTGVTTGVPRCDFPFGFLEPPHLDVSIFLADTMEWTEEDDLMPVAEACVVNWWRPPKHKLFCAADVSVTARGLRNGLHVVVVLEFSGPAIATPLVGVDEFEPTNPSFEGGGPPP